jgi:hypothetical protein
MTRSGRAGELRARGTRARPTEQLAQGLVDHVAHARVSLGRAGTWPCAAARRRAPAWLLGFGLGLGFRLATIEELARAPGMTRKAAEQVAKYFAEHAEDDAHP